MILEVEFLDGTSRDFRINGAVELEQIGKDFRAWMNTDFRVTSVQPASVLFKYDDGKRLGMINMASVKYITTFIETKDE